MDETQAIPANESEPRIAHFLLQRKLGEGGMGSVYAALDQRLERTVALKLVRPDRLDQSSRDQLLREARMAAALNHPAICQLFDVGEASGQFYLAMELLEGELLSDRIRRGALPPREACGLAIELLNGLAFIHERQLVHRDLKPANLMLTPHGLKILDFGLAVRVDGASAGRELAGTPAYLAPECLDGGAPDCRSDLFAVGAILYEMLSGQRAFPGETLAEILAAIRFAQPPPLIGSPMAAATDRIVRRALAKLPTDRFSNSIEFRTALEQSDSPSVSPPVVRPSLRLIVLPFRPLRKDEDSEFLAVSLPEAITTNLSSLSSVMVRSSAAAARFAGPELDLERLAREASVDVALTGTLMRSANQIRVNIQLLEVPSGRLLKAHQAQAALEDLFTVEDQLLRGIISALRLELSPSENKGLEAAARVRGAAYELFLRANLAGNDFSRLAEARDLYRACLEEDPDYAPAWARLGRIHRLLAKYTQEPITNLALSREAFERAIALQPDLEIGHSLYAQLEADLGLAPQALDRLLARRARHENSPEIHAGLVYACRFTGLLEESIAFHQECKRLDPLYPTSATQSFFHAGQYRQCLETYSGDFGYIDVLALLYAGDAAEALNRARTRLENDRSGLAPLAPLARIFASSLVAILEGRLEEGLAISNRALDGFFLGPEEQLHIVRHLLRCGDLDRGAQLMAATVEKGWGGVQWITNDPWFQLARGRLPYERAKSMAQSFHEAAQAVYHRHMG
jgi:serine/threonine protein kinase